MLETPNSKLVALSFFTILSAFVIKIIMAQKQNSSAKKLKEASSLKDFNYKFDDKGKLQEIDDNGDFTGEGFKFDVYPSHAENQRRYQAIGEILNEEVYDLLESRGNLEKVMVGKSKQKSFIFCSKDVKQKNKLVVMIHGSGVVRAGQWARRLIINEDLDKGTMLPYINHINKRGWGVVVMNTNHNTDEKEREIPGSESPEEHAETVWSEMIKDSKAEQIVVIAHSYGGVVTMSLAGGKVSMEDFKTRVVGVFFTDSVHYRGLSGHKDVDKRLKKIGKNYVASDQEVGILLREDKNDVPLYSAGHTKHEWTSWCSMNKIFDDMDRVFGHQENSTTASGDFVDKNGEEMEQSHVDPVGANGDGTEAQNSDGKSDSEGHTDTVESDMKMDTSDSRDNIVGENETKKNSVTAHSEEL